MTRQERMHKTSIERHAANRRRRAATKIVNARAKAAGRVLAAATERAGRMERMRAQFAKLGWL